MYFDPRKRKLHPLVHPSLQVGFLATSPIYILYIIDSLSLHYPSFLHFLPHSLSLCMPYRVQQSCASQERRAVFVPAPLSGSRTCQTELLQAGHAGSHTVHGPASSPSTLVRHEARPQAGEVLHHLTCGHFFSFPVVKDVLHKAST